jgi:hypothetical protein
MKRSLFAFTLSLLFLFILGGCNSTPKDAPNTLKIAEADEKIIREYLDTKTDDISAPYSGGKMYSEYKILGTDNDKVYVWMLKYEYSKQGKELTNGVSIPIVLYIESQGDIIEIKKHKIAGNGVESNYKSSKRLFPQNVRDEMVNIDNELINKLEEIIRNRVKEDTGI